MTRPQAHEQLTAGLGQARQVQLSTGPVAYFDTGDPEQGAAGPGGPPLLLLHGIMTNGALWRHVAPALAARHRCLTLQLPLGSHTVPASPDADLSPSGLTRMLLEFMDTLGLSKATVLANDTAGVLTQTLLVQHPDRLVAAVLTPCDAFDNFLPRAFLPLRAAALLPGGLKLVGLLLQWPPARHLPITYGWLTRRHLPAALWDSYLQPLRRDRRIRHDLHKVLRGVSSSYTAALARQLHQVRIPVLIAWAQEDRLFPLRHADWLAALLPHAHLVSTADSYSLVPEDQPNWLADEVLAFLGSHSHSDTDPAAEQCLPPTPARPGPTAS